MVVLNGYTEYKDGKWAFCGLCEKGLCEKFYPCHFLKWMILSDEESFEYINSEIPRECDFDSEDVLKSMIDENDHIFPDYGEW